MENIQKFQDLLKRLFQFETSDLDFGIYRILNYKREQINKFINEDLVKKVESAFAKHKDERLTNISQRFEEGKEKVIQGLGTQAFTPTGELKEEFKDTPLGRDFVSIKAQKDEVEKIDEIKLQVFNDLYNFFSRYYEEGDFVPQYRKSIKGHKYAIPYNGEEVKLYWANNEQYYTKTGLLFRDYTFKAGDFKVIFRITSAREELGSKKATKSRFFILDDAETVHSPLAGEGEGAGDNKNLIIRFQYRELTEKEVKSYGVEGGSNASKQEKINERSYEKVLKKIEKIELKGFLSREYKNEKPLLLYQLNRFTAKNTKDYFIHKNLKKFLSEQLDYFIKAEVLDIETLEKERFLDKHITRAKVVREIGEELIDFLSQIENFQKRLWEKKKFVLKTEYVITTDRVPEELHQEIWTNKDQKKEWKDLGFEIPKTKKDLKKRTIPIDTKYFSQEFKEKLLEKLTHNSPLSEGCPEGTGCLDNLLDGILIKSENYQALSLLLGKYKEKVKTIYIDPPFNLGTNADFLYNVNYKDSSWISILENRLQLARDLMDEKGSIFVRCDYNGNMYVRLLMNDVFREENFRNEMIINRTLGKKKIGESFPINKDSLFLFSKDTNLLLKEVEKPREECEVINSIIKNLTKKQMITDNLRNEILSLLWVPLDHRPGERTTSSERTVFGKKIFPPKGRHWIKSQDKLNQLAKESKLRLKCGNCGYLHYSGVWEKCSNCGKDEPIIELFLDRETISESWLDIPGYSQTWDFQTENSEILLKRVVESTSNESDLVMDFFLGSGTTIAVAHKLKRKWIGVEMGEHFWTVVLPRMKKVLAYDKSGISKEKDVKEKYNPKTAGGFLKYQILEQYEDTLDNIELTLNEQAQLKFGDDYLLKYFLDYETRENPYLLNIEKLKSPFSYKLKVNLEEVGEPHEMVVDILETFNYLLGLKVKKIKARKGNTLSANADTPLKEGKGRKYLFILGEKEGKEIAVVWREYNDNWSDDDFKRDREFIIKELEPWTPYVVYINGQSVLTPKLGKHTVEIHYIEPKFKKSMEEAL